MRFSDAAWSPQMHPAIWVARFYVQEQFEKWTGKEFVVTSGPRPQRPGGSSKHGTGEAFDFRIRDQFVDCDDVRAFSLHLQRQLGDDFDVVLEGPDAFLNRYRYFPNGDPRPPHIHVEYDPKGRLAEMIEP